MAHRATAIDARAPRVADARRRGGAGRATGAMTTTMRKMRATSTTRCDGLARAGRVDVARDASTSAVGDETRARGRVVRRALADRPTREAAEDEDARGTEARREKSRGGGGRRRRDE